LEVLGITELIVKITDPLGNIVYKNAGWDDNDFSSIDLQFSTSTELTQALPVDSNGDIIQGKYIIEYQGGILNYWMSRVMYCPTLPEIEIDLEYSCRISSITSTDATNYDLICGCSGSGGVTVTPNLTIQSHTLYYPNTMQGTIPAPVTVTTAINTITPIFTKRWTSRLTSFVSYEMPDVASSDNILYLIEGTLNGIQYTDVACSECVCALVDCITQLYNAYKRAYEKNTKEANDIKEKLDILYLTKLTELYLHLKQN